MPGTSSLIGTISGGSLTKRDSPSTGCVSLESALTLSFVIALALSRSKRARSSASTCCTASARIPAASTRAYHSSRLGMAAKPRIASR